MVNITVIFIWCMCLLNVTIERKYVLVKLEVCRAHALCVHCAMCTDDNTAILETFVCMVKIWHHGRHSYMQGSWQCQDIPKNHPLFAPDLYRKIWIATTRTYNWLAILHCASHFSQWIAANFFFPTNLTMCTMQCTSCHEQKAHGQHALCIE